MGRHGAHGCGRCLPCRLKKRREWTHRIILEASLHKDNCFLTLTYGDDPYTLVPADHRAFMVSLRQRLAPLRVRFYAVGEYGERHQRPHFHYALFGYPPCLGKKKSYRCCPACDLVEDAWGKGFIYNKPLEPGSARYIARYVVKKMTRHDDPRLGNRHPEFARMSLKPGLGAGVVENLAAVISRYNLLTSEGDVPITLRHGTQEWPLGRYLRRKLRVELGLPPQAPTLLTAEASYAAFLSDEAMRAVQAASLADPSHPSIKYHLLKASEGRRLSLQRREQLFSKKGVL